MTNDNKRNLLLYGLIKEIHEQIGGTAIPAAFGRGGNDSVSGVRRKCVIDTEWIEAIEQGLTHIGKAIEQARSLLKSEGEVVRIDRAKKATKESIEYLSRHSNMIKRVDGEGLPSPDEIYVTNNDENYAVYENRFLYFLLTFLRDFISERYERIARSAFERGLKLNIEREGETKENSFGFRLELTDAGRSEGESAADKETSALIERIGTALQITDAYLETPLMRRVSTAPKLYPPIARTNIIRGNVHFNAAFELYSFISAYDGPGYEASDEQTVTSVLTARQAELIGEAAVLQRFIAYQSVFDNWKTLEEDYSAMLRERELEEIKSSRSRIDSLRKGYLSGEKTAEELINKLLEANERLSAFVENCRAEIGSATASEEESKRRAESAEFESGRLKDALKSLEDSFAERLEKAESAIKLSSENRISELEEKHRAELEELRETAIKERDLFAAMIKGEKLFGGEPGEDISTREEMIRLENERNALNAYYKKQWSEAKKRIRAEERKRKAGEDK